MTPVTRRVFVKSTFTAAALSVLPGARSASPNEKVIIGVMGCGGRGTWLAQSFARRPDCEIAWLCDPDQRRYGRALQTVTAVQGRNPKTTQDFRRLLDDREVDAVINATPDHWHALGTLLACQAGKDVYVEKPLSHNLREGRKMVAAARKHERVVQVGLQSRSAPYVQAAREYIRSGALGDVHLVKVYNLMSHSRQQTAPDQAPPPELDWDLWSGPATLLPYNPGRYWLNQFEYSCGPIPGDLVHQLDLARFLVGDPPPPDNVTQNGGLRVLKDGRDTPDTQIATFDYGRFVLHFEGALWMPYQTKTPMDLRDIDRFPDWPFNGTRIEIHGTQGFMYVGRHGDGWQAFDAKAAPVRSHHGRQGDPEHQDNFVQCIRNRRTPNADVEQGHFSTLLCHLANAAWRARRPALRFDPASDAFGDAPEASRYLGREYRAPWTLPESA